LFGSIGPASLSIGAIKANALIEDDFRAKYRSVKINALVLIEPINSRMVNSEAP
jgi:hypothetical protein